MGAGKFTPRSGHRRGVEADLVTRLRQLPPGPGPDAGFAAELRSQLVAIAPRLIAESAGEAASDAAGAPRRASRIGVLGVLRRPLLATSGAAAVLVLLLGLAVWMSGGALPGQSLYGIKRASENFQLSVAGSDTDKGMKYLSYATNRAEESAKLVGTAPSPASAQHAKLVASTLRSADADTRDGVRLLTDAAVADMSADPIAPVTGWVSQQRARIAALAPHLPSGAARSQSASSLALLQRVAARIAALHSKIGCSCLSRAHADELGPIPCSTCTAVQPPTGAGGSSVPFGGSASPPTGAVSSAVSGSSGSLPAGVPGSVSSTPAPPAVNPVPSLPNLGGGSASAPASAVPSMPGGALPSVPLSVGPSGISASVPGLGGISLGPSGAAISVSPSIPTLP